MSRPVFNPHVYPEGGYAFVDSGGIRIEGTSFDDLVHRVRDFRISQGKPIGNPVAEVNDFICARDPTACQIAAAAKPKPTSGVSPFGSRVVRWLGKISEAFQTAEKPLVSKGEAERRAAICLACPRQLSWRSGCGGCDSSARRLGIALRDGKEVSKGASLAGCEILSEDTQTSVWLRLAPAKNPELPDNCWRRKA